MPFHQGPPVYKPFALTLVFEDGREEDWVLMFSDGPKFDNWRLYAEYIENAMSTVLEDTKVDKLYGEHQINFRDRIHIWGFYCPKIKECDAVLLRSDWKRVWEALGFVSPVWRLIQ